MIRLARPGPRPRLMELAAAGVLAAGVGCTRAPAGGRSPEPDRGCCQELRTVYEASVFKVDVMRVVVRVDEPTADAVRVMTSNTPRSAPLEDQVARRYQAASTAAVEVEFLMGMSGETFVGNTTRSLRGLVRDGVMPEEATERLAAEAGERFGFLNTAGVRPADRIRYDVVADTVTTTYLRGDQVLMHDRQVGSLRRNAVLASYFAPSSGFRHGLLQQVFAR